jgi:hypothetical protein
MKAIRQHAHGGPESLRYEGAPRPLARDMNYHPAESCFRAKSTAL